MKIERENDLSLSQSTHSFVVCVRAERTPLKQCNKMLRWVRDHGRVVGAQLFVFPVVVLRSNKMWLTIRGIGAGNSCVQCAQRAYSTSKWKLNYKASQQRKKKNSNTDKHTHTQLMMELYRRLYVRVVCSREFYWSSCEEEDSKIVCKKSTSGFSYLLHF